MLVSQLSAGPPGQARPPIAHSAPDIVQRPTAMQLVPGKQKPPIHGSAPRAEPPALTHARALQRVPMLPRAPHWASLVQTLAGSSAGKNDTPTPRPADMGSRRKASSASFTMDHLVRPPTS